MGTSKRLLTEIEEWRSSPPPMITAEPLSDSNVMDWKATMEGPVGSPYEGRIFNLLIEFQLKKIKKGGKVEKIEKF